MSWRPTITLRVTDATTGTEHVYDQARLLATSPVYKEDVGDDGTVEVGDLDLVVPKSFLGATRYEDLPEDETYGHRAELVVDGRVAFDGLVFTADVRHYDADESFTVRLVASALPEFKGLAEALYLGGTGLYDDVLAEALEYEGFLCDFSGVTLNYSTAPQTCVRLEDAARALLDALPVAYALPPVPDVEIPTQVGTRVRRRELWMYLPFDGATPTPPRVSAWEFLRGYSAALGLGMVVEYQAYPSRSFDLRFTADTLPDEAPDSAIDLSALKGAGGVTTGEAFRTGEPRSLRFEGDFPGEERLVLGQRALFLSADALLVEPHPEALLATNDYRVSPGYRQPGTADTVPFRHVATYARSGAAAGSSGPWKHVESGTATDPESGQSFLWAETVYYGEAVIPHADRLDYVWLVQPYYPSDLPALEFAYHAYAREVDQPSPPGSGGMPVYGDDWASALFRLRDLSMRRRIEVEGEFHVGTVPGLVGDPEGGALYDGRYHAITGAEVDLVGDGPSTLTLQRPAGAPPTADWADAVGAVTSLEAAWGETKTDDNGFYLEVSWRPPPGPEMGVLRYEVEILEGSSWNGYLETHGTQFLVLDGDENATVSETFRVRALGRDGVSVGPWTEIEVSTS